MRKQLTLAHEFVELIPEVLEDNTLYVSIEFATIVHKCCCGCGQEVVTPLSPGHWQLTFDGETISLYPSIGNWGFKCQSHYWIKGNRVKWAPRWSKEEIAAGRGVDSRARSRTDGTLMPIGPAKVRDRSVNQGLWRRLTKWRRLGRSGCREGDSAGVPGDPPGRR